MAHALEQGSASHTFTFTKRPRLTANHISQIARPGQMSWDSVPTRQGDRTVLHCELSSHQAIICAFPIFQGCHAALCKHHVLQPRGPPQRSTDSSHSKCAADYTTRCQSRASSISTSRRSYSLETIFAVASLVFGSLLWPWQT